MIKCNVCGGARKLTGLGMMQRKCHNCDGKGFVTAEEPERLAAEFVDETLLILDPAESEPCSLQTVDEPETAIADWGATSIPAVMDVPAGEALIPGEVVMVKKASKKAKASVAKAAKKGAKSGS